MTARLPVTIGMIVLNEEQFLFHNLTQHYPLSDRIVIVEGADPLYPPDGVTADGLSTDRTAEIVREFPDPDRKIIFIQHGRTSVPGEAAKCELRNRYAEHAIDGSFLAVIDADEFYTHADFEFVLEWATNNENELAWAVPTVHFWKQPTRFITGGYYDIGHTRFFRWRAGARYVKNHNFPEFHSRFLHTICNRVWDRFIDQESFGPTNIPLYTFRSPHCFHFGFCKSPKNMADKTAYYITRGEAQTRPRTTESRAAWFDEQLPPGHEVRWFDTLNFPEAIRRLGWPNPVG